MAVVLVLVVLKGLALAVDPTVRLYLGDSAAYLAGSLSDSHLPRDRSFVYSLLLRVLVAPTGWLPTLLLWQAAAGVGTALLLWVIFVRHLGVSRRWAPAGACALALDPAQLFYERMVLAEAFSQLAFSACLAAAGEYLRTARPIWLPLVAGLGMTAASLRLNYLPVALTLSLAAPVIPALLHMARPRWREWLVHAAIAACSVAVFHMTYRQVVASVFGVPPTYLPSAGFMQLSLVAPLLRAEHFERVGLPADLGERLAYALDDPDARTAHAWQPGGLMDAIAGYRVDVEAVARSLSRMAAFDAPLGVVRLGMHTSGNYFHPTMTRWALEDDLGRREYPPDLLRSLRHSWGYEATDLAYRMTPVSRYFAWSRWWLVACLCLAVPLAVLHVRASWRTPMRPHAVLCAMATASVITAHLLLINVALFRYLHPLPFLVWLHALPVIYQAAHRWNGFGGTEKAQRHP